MRRVFFALAVLVSIVAARPVEASWGCWGFGTNYYGYGLPAGWYTGVNDRVPPYFALHPPVYYSGEIVRIPYGASPFAYLYGTPWAGNAVGVRALPALATVAATSEPAEGVMIENEHFKANEGALPAPKEAKPARPRGLSPRDVGLMIENPHYRREAKVAKVDVR